MHMTHGVTVCAHLEHNDEKGGYRADNAQLLQQGPEGGLHCIGVIVHTRNRAVILKARVMPEKECQDPCIGAHTLLTEPTYRCSSSAAGRGNHTPVNGAYVLRPQSH